MSILYLVIALVILERAAELAFATRNTSRLRQAGAVEFDERGYPWFVVLHGAWLGSLFVLVPADAVPSWPLLALYGVLQLGRLWVIATLGRRWTTRILVRPGAALIKRGPYRYLRHPNYAIVAGEIAVLPLAFGATAIALIFSALNLVLILRRIRIEDRALALSAHRSTVLLGVDPPAPRDGEPNR